MDIRTVSALLHGAWLINKDFADQHIGLVSKMLLGQETDFGFEKKAHIVGYSDDGPSEAEKREMAANRVVVLGNVPTLDMYNYNFVKAYGNISPGTVAIIPMDTPLMKHDAYCGGVGMVTMTRWIELANRDENISAVLLDIDSPGGMVDGTSTLSDAILKSKKPVWGIVNDGMAASAAYWHASSTGRLLSSHAKNQVGSIGVYTTIVDYTGYLEKEGIKLHEIYAPQSTAKNLDYKLAKKGKYEMMEAHLSVLAESFIQHVQMNREISVHQSADPFTGAMFFAPEAKTIGLIDGIQSYNDTVLELAEHAAKRPNKTATKNNAMSSIFNSKLEKSILALVNQETPTAEQLAEVNAQLEASNISVRMALPGETLELEVSESAEMKAIGLKLANANVELATVAAERDMWQKKAEELGAKPPVAEEEVLAGDDKGPKKKPAAVHPWDEQKEVAKVKAEERAAFRAKMKDV